MLKLKLQYFGHLMQRTNSLEKTLMLIKIEGGRRRGQQWVRWLDGITDSMDMSLSSSRSWWWTGKPGVLQSMVSQRVGHNWMTELNWRIPLSTGLSLLGKISGVHKTGGGGGKRPGKLLVSYFSMWNYYMTPLWSSLEGALFWDESEYVTSSFWGSLGHLCPQFFPIPPPPSSNCSASFLPISPQANFIPELSSLVFPGSYPTQSWP